MTAVLEPASEGFQAYIEEVPEITAQGAKIATIKENLLEQLATHQDTTQDHIVLTISVRVEIDF